MPVRVAVLGSTGSIGTQTLDAIGRLNADGFEFDVASLVAGSNRALLAEQAGMFPRARARLCADEGPVALVEEASAADVDVVVHAVVGSAGLAASFAAAKAGGRRLCLANKESLVVGGDLLTSACRAGGVEIVPIDSEHTAIFQALAAGRREDVGRIILTASGGPFRDKVLWPAEKLFHATASQALAHPTWRMGGKITVDSATLFNKGFELIEAVRLYGVSHERVDVVVHPQSVVHSMVEFRDGSTLAHLSPVDMRLPIAYALTHPRRGTNGTGTLDWSRGLALTFEPVDETRFPALALCRRALDDGGASLAWLNGSNEVAVEAFLAGRLPFGRIAVTVERALDACPLSQPESPDDLLRVDADARRFASGVSA